MTRDCVLIKPIARLIVPFLSTEALVKKTCSVCKASHNFAGTNSQN